MNSLVRAGTILASIIILSGAQCTPPTVGGQSATQASLKQGWNQEETIKWYTTSQGSRLIPQAWLHALEQPDGTQPFLDPAYLGRVRYLPLTKADWNGPAPNPSCPTAWS